MGGYAKIGIGVLVSGGGSNFQALAEAVESGDIPLAEIKLLVSNREGAGAVDRAQKLGIPSLVAPYQKEMDRAAYFRGIAEALKKSGVELVCLAGFLLKLDPVLIQAFPGRIVNIHPALLPKFGGRGMYGRYVHEAVIAAGEKESGCTVHLVDEEYDHGPPLGQAKVPVLPDDTPEVLAARVLEKEHRLYPQVVRGIVKKLLSEKNTKELL